MSLFIHAVARLQPKPSLAACSRLSLHTTALGLRAPYKNTQDKDSLSPQSAENTKSARDNDVAALDKAAYNKSSGGGPEAARRRAQDETTEEDGGDPLEFSGANQQLSKPRGDEKSQLDRAPGKEARAAELSSGGKGPHKKSTSR